MARSGCHSFPAERKLIRKALLLHEELEIECFRQRDRMLQGACTTEATSVSWSRGTYSGRTGGQRGRLLLGARVPQHVQEERHAVRVVEGDVGGGTGS